MTARDAAITPQHKDPFAEVMRERPIRREELRQLIPLADTTIYEMEQRGEFPKRFYLTARCAVWNLSEVLTWLDARRKDKTAAVAHPDVTKRRSRPVRQ
jgi:prophage regulatory protein